MLTLILSIFSGLFGFAITQDYRFFYGVGLFLALAILLLPHTVRDIEIFEPINFVFISTLIGITLRGLYILWSDSPIVHEHLLLGHDRRILGVAIVAAVFGGLIVAVSYLIGRKVNLKVPAQYLHLGRIPVHRVWFIYGILFLIGLGSLILYLSAFDISLIPDLSDLSKKRRLSVGGGGYTVLGYHIWGVSLLNYITLFGVARIANKNIGAVSTEGLAVGVSALLFIYFSVLRGARTPILALLVQAVIIWYFIRSRVRFEKLVSMAIGGLGIAALLGILRRISQQNLTNLSILDPGPVFEQVVGNRNWFGISKLAHITRTFPNEHEYLDGASLVNWLAAPIPRSVWPSKPPTRIGPFLGDVVFHNEAQLTGVPPGFLAEGYLNFGVVGFIAAAALLGLVLGSLWTSHRRAMNQNPTVVVSYAILVLPLGLLWVGSDLAGAIVPALKAYIPFVALIILGRMEV